MRAGVDSHSVTAVLVGSRCGLAIATVHVLITL
jgi:hypothetical protein